MSGQTESAEYGSCPLEGRRCLFCRSELNARTQSQEHVVPQWLARHMGISDKPSGHTTMVWEPEYNHYRPETEREHRLSAHVEGRVCVECNTGWMSRLESEARSLVSQSVDGTRRGPLSSEDKYVLARWMIKTAFMLNSSSPVGWTMNPCDYHSFAGGGVPDWLDLHFIEFDWPEPVSWFQHDEWTMIMRATALSEQPILRGTTKAGFKIAMQLGQLAFMVSHFPHKEFAPLCWHGVHQPFWLPGERAGRYEASDQLLQHMRECSVPLFDAAEAFQVIHQDLIPEDGGLFDMSACIGEVDVSVHRSSPD